MDIASVTEQSKLINLQSNKSVKIEQEKKKRIITKTKKWERVDMHNQIHYIADTLNINYLVKGQIQNKIRGYKSQDQKKKLFCDEKFIDYEFVIKLLQHSEIKCFYCRKDVLLLYENVREPRQWSIERIDNYMGHNKDNVEIACLNCNLRRRTMYFERYITTKQLKIIKIV